MGTKENVAGKRLPPYVTYVEAKRRNDILVDAYRALCEALLMDDLSPQTHAKILSLRAALAQVELDGS